MGAGMSRVELAIVAAGMLAVFGLWCYWLTDGADRRSDGEQALDEVEFGDIGEAQP